MSHTAPDLLTDRRRMTEECRMAADAVWSFLAPGYGPDGGHRLLDLGDEVQLLRSAASGLSEQAVDAGSVPFQDLARSVRSAVGDQATATALLASGLVRSAVDAEEDGLPRPVIVDGLRLAARQAVATLRAMAAPCDAATALGHASDLDRVVVDVILDGLSSWGQDGVVTLDDVDLRVEPVDAPEWSEGTVAEPQHAPDVRSLSDAGVLVVDRGWELKPRSEGMTRRINHPDALAAAAGDERRMRQAVLDNLLEIGADLVVCGAGVDADLCDMARRAGLWVWTDAPKDARRRLQSSTGATPVPDLLHASGDAVGRADLKRRPRRRDGWWVVGPAMSATLVLPSGLSVMQAAVTDEGERLLRAAGVVLVDPRGVPGGGRWQRKVATALRKAAVHAPGKTGLAVEVAADVFDRMADLLVANAGGDPLTTSLLDDADGVTDAAPCVLAAVQAAFDAAITMLRIDGRYDKKPSTPEALRGGTGPIGSPKGMPGDVPPLM